jgi:hypothetical protein
MAADVLLLRILFVLGLGFFVANLRILVDLLRFQLRKRSAVLVWQNPKPRFYRFNLMLGVVFAVLIAVKYFVQHLELAQLFGETMMLTYYGGAFPLSTRIARGFYRDGVWSDSGFLPWSQISAVSWKEEGSVTLVLISRVRSIGRRLQVPGHLYGQARRVLRDKVKAHDIHIGGAGLDLGSREEGDAI